jgi:hypothetical protein
MILSGGAKNHRGWILSVITTQAGFELSKLQTEIHISEVPFFSL